MGFYAPAQIVRDAREHGVEVLPVDVSFSTWDSTLEPAPPQTDLTLRCIAKGDASKGRQHTPPGLAADASRLASRAPQHEELKLALRLGLREVDGLKEEDARAIAESRATSIAALHRAGVSVSALEKLAAADCFRSLGLDRRAALWEVKALARAKPLPLFAFAAARDHGDEAPVALPEMPLSEHVVNDYQTLKLSLKAHPMSFLRALCDRERVIDNQKLKTVKNGAFVSVAGVVLVRQRPGSAKGVVFLTLEDEFSVCNAVIWSQVLEPHRAVVMGSRLMLIRGRVQRTGDIIHVVANRIEDKTQWLSLLVEDQNLLRNQLARADEVVKPGPGPTPAGRHPRHIRVIPKSRDFH
jgi:error-prone DNA polymerase